MYNADSFFACARRFQCDELGTNPVSCPYYHTPLLFASLYLRRMDENSKSEFGRYFM